MSNARAARRRGRSRTRRAVRGALWALAAAHLVEAMVLRRRRERLAALSTAGAAQDRADKLALVSAAGVDVGAATRAAAAYEMELDGAEVIDLVPGDLPAERALSLLRRVDLDRLTADVMYTPGGTHEALAVHPSVAERMQVDAQEQPDQDRFAMVRRTVKAQRYAPSTTVLRVAPDLQAAPFGPLDRWRELEGLSAAARPYAELTPVLVGSQLAQLAFLAAGLVVAPVPAAAALAAWSAKPRLVFGGGTTDQEPAALVPPDVDRASDLRFPLALVDVARTALVGWAETRAARERRLAEPLPSPPRLDEFFEERQDGCPWCGSTDITARFDTNDLFQAKPGEFHLDDCLACGHIFQNPRLTPAGLDYYYADFYEGIGEEMWEVAFAGGMQHNLNRAESIAQAADTPPTTWLDVGTGHGHFPLAARQRWPETRFDGADMSETVLEAQRRGRIDTAFQGIFTELADTIPGTYDVVSMHHYLEHTLDQRAELDAAAKVLAPGGLLMIEVPDPATPWNRRLGRFWFFWAQPQHLHFLQCDELVRHLQSKGFEVVSAQRAEATLGFDIAAAVAFVVQEIAASPHLPWRPVPPLSQRLKRMAAVAGAVPVVALAALADAVKDGLHLDGEIGNAYRVVARAPGGDG